MLVWDPVCERNLPFGRLKTAALGERASLWVNIVSNHNIYRQIKGTIQSPAMLYVFLCYQSHTPLTSVYSQSLRSSLPQWTVTDTPISEVPQKELEVVYFANQRTYRVGDGVRGEDRARCAHTNGRNYGPEGRRIGDQTPRLRICAERTEQGLDQGERFPCTWRDKVADRSSRSSRSTW